MPRLILIVRTSLHRDKGLPRFVKIQATRTCKGMEQPLVIEATETMDVGKMADEEWNSYLEFETEERNKKCLNKNLNPG